MRNSRLLPYETIVQATTGEPEAVNAVLQHYGRYKCCLKEYISSDERVDFLKSNLQKR